MSVLPAVRATRAPSRLARQLGVAGLLPFVALAWASWSLAPPQDQQAVQALLAYGCSILAFLGAIHWGLAMRDEAAAPAAAWLWGVLPSLAAWLLVLCDPRVGLAALAAALWACWVVDRRLYPRFGLEAWLQLRLALTVVASACCLVAASSAP